MLHPDPITGGIDGNLNIAMDSGALFARKFDLEVRLCHLSDITPPHARPTRQTTRPLSRALESLQQALMIAGVAVKLLPLK